MLSAISSGIQLIVDFFTSLFSFVGTLFTGLVNLLKMIPQAYEAFLLFAFMLPAWVAVSIYSLLGLIVGLAVLKWIKGII